uniref:Piwi domain-containing protein n=1 Tax=Meloidogyne hapla TaxID=6305 RepID=A0A1I8BDY6_MELHA
MERSGSNNQPLGQRGQGRNAAFASNAEKQRTSGRGRGRGRGGRGRGRGGNRPPRRTSPGTTTSAEKRRKTQKLEEIKKEMESLGLEVGDPHMESKTEPGEVGEKIRVLTNVYGVKMDEKTVYRYDITISAVPKKKGPARIEFTKRTKDDCVVVDRRDFCRVAFDFFFDKEKSVFGGNRYTLYYDLQSILYTLSQLSFDGKDEQKFQLNKDECERHKLLQDFNRVEMLVRKVNKQVELADLSFLTNDMSKQNHSLAQFIELATSQHPLQTPNEHVILGGGTSYLINPGNYNFIPEDGPLLSEQNKYLAIGIHKSVRYVEGPAGRNSKKVGLIVESKKTPFHNTDGTLLDKTASIVGPNAIRSNGSVDRGAIAYLNQQLKATAFEKGQTNYYPMELCSIRDNQRAQLSQLNAREVAAMIKVFLFECTYRIIVIKASAVPPSNLKRQIESSPLVAKGRRLPPPTILFGQERESMVDKDSGKWHVRDSFYLPATIEKWAIYLIPAARTREKYRFGENEMNDFVRAYINCCHQHGLVIGMPADKQMLQPNPEDVDKCVRICKENDCDFVFFVTSDAVTNLHNLIKGCERKYEIVTQDLKLSNAAEIAIRGKQETVLNIVCKTNEKMGGINYTIRLADQRIHDLIEDGTLFIGLGISHPGALGNYERARGAAPNVPSVIGYSANMKKHPFDFVGDYLFDEARRDEKYTTLAHITKNCVTRYQDQRGDTPKRLILFRNGMSEGQFATAKQYEIPMVRLALRECSASNCKLTVLVSQKTHNIRLFAHEELSKSTGSSKNLNIKPGTGTTRTPRFTILEDDTKFKMDQIEQICYALSFGHKIINSPISLPAPVYIALMYAKRGRAIFQVNREYEEIAQMRKDDGQFDYQQISDSLCYTNTKLKNLRINA